MEGPKVIGAGTQITAATATDIVLDAAQYQKNILFCELIKMMESDIIHLHHLFHCHIEFNFVTVETLTHNRQTCNGKEIEIKMYKKPIENSSFGIGSVWGREFSEKYYGRLVW